jgi:DNA-binding NarL/FixJ family response regulator
MLCRLFLPRLLYLEKHLHFSVKLLIVCGVKGFMFSSLEKERIRILLIEEEVLVRDALKALIASWGFNVGEVANLGRASEDVRSFQPDIVLLSLSGNKDDDRKIVRDIISVCRRVPLLALLGNDCDQEFALYVVRLGARGVVLKTKPPLELRKAIHKVYETDEIWLDRSGLSKLITQLSTPTEIISTGSELLPLLSEREREVVALVTQGLKNKDIGERLFISEITVRHHLTAIFNKLGLSSRFELITYMHTIAANKSTADSSLDRLAV